MELLEAYTHIFLRLLDTHLKKYENETPEQRADPNATTLEESAAQCRLAACEYATQLLRGAEELERRLQ